MRTIYKYMLFRNDNDQLLEIPEGTIRHVEMQDAMVCVWAEVLSDAPPKERYFRVFGTGHKIPAGFTWRGTTQDPPFVWHVFEKIPE